MTATLRSLGLLLAATLLLAAGGAAHGDVILTPVDSKPFLPTTIDDLWPEEDGETGEDGSEDEDFEWTLDPSEDEPLTDPAEPGDGSEDEFVIVIPGRWDYRFPAEGEGEVLYMLATSSGAVASTAVPEPATIAVLAMGLVGLIVCRWRRVWDGGDRSVVKRGNSSPN